MKRKIYGFHQDQLGDWVAELECGHTRHLRHNPPWTERPFLESESRRTKFIGTELDCKTCEELAMNLIPSNDEKRRIAEAVKAACLKAAIEAYQDAEISGLCPEGVREVVLDAIKSLNVEAVLRELPG
ncbi:MAG: hypothetical protein Kow0042_01470 [Calditrichia bacterium]